MATADKEPTLDELKSRMQQKNSIYSSTVQQTNDKVVHARARADAEKASKDYNDAYWRTKQKPDTAASGALLKLFSGK